MNFGVKNFTFLLLLTDVLLLGEHLINLVILTFFNTIVRAFLFFIDAIDDIPIIRQLAKQFRFVTHQIQEAGQRKLYLINYPECEECSDENTFGNALGGNTFEFCEVAKIRITGSNDQNNRVLSVSNFENIITYSGSDYKLGDECYGASIPLSYDDFILNQTKYVITYNTYVIDLTSNSFTVNNEYYDNNPIYFGDNIDYTVTIRDKSKTTGIQTPVSLTEEGCQIYDVPYDESIVYEYYSGETSSRITIPKNSYKPNMDISATSLANETNTKYFLPAFDEKNIYDRITLKGYTEFSNGVFYIVPGTQTNKRLFDILKEFRRRKRVGKLFCGGIVNYSFIDNWLSGSLYFFQFKSKQKVKRKETKIKYCREVVRYVDSQERFYYRSTPYDVDTNTWGGSILKKVSPLSTLTTEYRRLGHPTTFVDLGPRDEFINEICVDPQLDPNCAVARNIGPTSFQSFGEIMGFAINYRMDVSNNDFDINQFFDNDGFTKMGISRVLDGDLLQLISINNEAGIREFDLQDSNYIGYSYQYLDPDLFPQVFKNGNQSWGPTPITLTLDEDGKRIRLCLNEPGRLTESSQEVPFFLWDKKGTGFGSYVASLSDDQSWDYTTNGIKVMSLQGMTYAYKYTGTGDNPSDKYLLLPITYTFSGETVSNLNVTETFDFDVIDANGTDNHTSYDDEYPGFTYLFVTNGTEESPTAGILYTRYGSSGTWDIKNWNDTMDFIIKKSEDYYIGTKQILSTPFLFYFGLRPGRTGLDKFIKVFGPPGAFK